MSFPLAASFAAQAHTTQRRDDAASTPYINHPLEGCAHPYIDVPTHDLESHLGCKDL